MPKPRVQFSSVGDLLPALAEPFAVLLDANDEDWTDRPKADRLIRNLLDAGCRYFVCFGRNSEALHDHIDDVIVGLDFRGVATTWHEDEPKEDVVEFFNRVATSDMKDALVLVRDLREWKSLF